MGKSKIRFSRIAASAIIITLVLLSFLCAISAYAENSSELAQSGADTYYLYGMSTNDPNFASMTSPTGAFSYNSEKGYYFYDITSFSGGDYCFVISTVSNSGKNAADNQAVTNVSQSGSYYLQRGNYSVYTCMHLYNPKAEPIRLRFASVSEGLYAEKVSSEEATTIPTQPTSAPTEGSSLKIESFSTDLASPQYNGVRITLYASANAEGAVYYRFTSKNNSTQAITVLSDYSLNDTAYFTPATAGNYTLKVELLDDEGNSASRELSYKVNDGLESASPYIKSVTPDPSDIALNTPLNISVSAGGAVTGTRLIFYKFTVTDPSGEICNTPYYTLSPSYSFTPISEGEYTVQVSAQGSDNATVTRDFIYTAVSAPQETDVTQPETTYPTSKPSTAVSLKGDVDADLTITIIDATYIQRYLAKIFTASELALENADVDGDGSVTIVDATYIQRYLAKIITKL